MKKILTVLLVLVVALTTVISTSALAFAEPTVDPDGYKIEIANLTNTSGLTYLQKGNKCEGNVVIRYTGTGTAPDSITVSRSNDSFDIGKMATATNAATVVSGLVVDKSGSGEYSFYVSDITYSGADQTLAFLVGAGSKYYTVSITNSKWIVDTGTQEPIGGTTANPVPKVIFSWKDLDTPLKEGETKEIEISMKNIGTVTMMNPIISFEPSNGIMVVGNQTAYEMSPIYAGSTTVYKVKVKALSGVGSQNQYLDTSVVFKYYSDNTYRTTSEGTVAGRVMVSTGSTASQTGAIPTPNVIVKSFDYGTSAIQAGDIFNLTVALKNTSKLADIENVVVTVAGGADLSINGGTNTFYYDSIKADDFEAITVPFKLAATLSTSAQPVNLNVNYEYVSEGTRCSGQSNLLVTIPATQPDKFIISEPVFGWVGAVGEETSFTMDYINKGKSMVYNVEATVSGDVSSYNSTLRVGNIEAGRNGVLSFIVMPQLEGDNKVNVDISYEDSNGSVIERHFETVVASFAMEPFDPGFEPVGPIEPVKKPFPWKVIIIIVVALAIVALIVWRVLAKRAKVKKEKELWAKWEAEEEAKEEQELLEEAKARENNTGEK